MFIRPLRDWHFGSDCDSLLTTFMKKPYPNSYWLEPDRILCGEYPKEIDDMEDDEAMDALLESGARVFIDLTSEGELKPYDVIARSRAEKLGIDPDTLQFHRFPVPDGSVPESTEDMQRIVDTVKAANKDELIAYIHCWGGRGRTGTVAGCLLSEITGHTGEDAMSDLQVRWQGCAKSERGPCPESDAQRNFILNWKPGN